MKRGEVIDAETAARVQIRGPKDAPLKPKPTRVYKVTR